MNIRITSDTSQNNFATSGNFSFAFNLLPCFHSDSWQCYEDRVIKQSLPQLVSTTSQTFNISKPLIRFQWKKTQTCVNTSYNHPSLNRRDIIKVHSNLKFLSIKITNFKIVTIWCNSIQLSGIVYSTNAHPLNSIQLSGIAYAYIW